MTPVNKSFFFTHSTFEYFPGS